MKALIVTADGFEDSELLVPKEALEKAGIEVRIATPENGHRLRGKHGGTVLADLTLRDVDPAQFDLLVLPGGEAPERIRRDEHAQRIVKRFFGADKPVAAICHGPQILVSARVLEGRRLTCHKSLANELATAGASYEDRPVVVDGKLVTSRVPGDLPAFVDEMLKLVRQ